MSELLDERVRPLVDSRPYAVGIGIYVVTIISSLLIVAVSYRLALFSSASLTTEFATPNLLAIGFMWGLIAGAISIIIPHYLTNIKSAALALEYVESRFATVPYPEEESS